MSPLLLWLACHRSGEDPEPASCAPDLALFEARVWDVVLGSQCTACHAPGGPGYTGSALKLDPEDLQASMEATYAVGERLLLKPSGQSTDDHGGGVLVVSGTEAYEALAFWVDWTSGVCEVPPPVTCEDQDAPRLLRRLTHAEYTRTIQDLLGVPVDPATLASDPVVDGFRNDAAALVVSDLLADQYRSAAEAVSAVAELPLPCTTQDAACAAAFIEAFGYRAFRRPLTQQDIDRYLALWEESATEDGFEEALRWVVAAMLQSPHLLYRSELGAQGEPGRFTLTSWEVASALSYTLWGTTPDEALLARAASGELDEPQAVAALAREMALDPRALETAADFVEAWLDLGPLDTVSREGLTPELRAAMRQETRDLVKDLAGSGGTLADLMQARHTFVSPELAALYGLEGSGRLELDGVRYGGLLTRGAVLATHGRPSGSGPVQRGVLVRERLLCEELPPPPSNLDTSPPEVDPAASTRTRYEEHAANPECSGCHDQIDPLGFAFEHYDQLGRWRTDDGGHPIDASGHLDALPFDGPFALADLLLADARFRGCFVQTWRRHATGAPACGEDQGPDVPLLEPLVALPQAASFLTRTGSPEEGDTLASGTRITPEEPEEPSLPEEGLTFALTVVDDWGTGYCADGEVTNGSDAPAVWTVRSPQDGAINNIWNAVVTLDGGDFVFSGVEWNAEIAPGGVASFGFCAER
jgi:hypothetical protein